MNNDNKADQMGLLISATKRISEKKIPIWRRIWSVVFVLCCLAQADGLELYYDFEGASSGSRNRTASLTGPRFIGTFHASKHGKGLPFGIAEKIPLLSERSREVLDFNGGFIWARYGSVIDVSRDMTINFWFRSEKWKTRATFITRIGGWRVSYHPGKKSLDYLNLQDKKTTVSFNVDLAENPDWQMLTLVKKGESLTLYLDGEKIESLPCDSHVPEGGDFYLGCSSTQGTSRYEGMMDDFSLWSSALPETKIKALYQGSSPLEVAAAGQLKRTVTTPFPETLDVFYPPKEVALLKDGSPHAVIVTADTEAFKGTGKKLQRALLESWGVEFPLMSWEEARATDKNLILFGAVNANEPLRRLMANSLLGDNRRGYELRTIPCALDYQRGVLYVGGKTETQVLEGSARLTGRFQNPAALPFFIECQGWDQAPVQAELDAMIAEIEDKYRNFGDMKNQRVLERILNKPVDLYRMTGNDAYVATFSKMLKIFVDNYDEGCGFRKLPPSFAFHLFPRYIYNVENSPAFTAEDRWRAAEITRKVTEMIQDIWDMSEPVSLYKINKQAYLGNHPCFAARSVAAAARYLLSRYRYAPAEYWKAVGDNAFVGVASRPFSPEDAGGYQYLTYRIFVDYALASGTYTKEFFKTSPEFKAYVEYAKNQFNHLGYTAGFGDALPIGQRSACPLLKQAMDILEDREAEYILSVVKEKDLDGFYGNLIREWGVRDNLPPPGKSSLGLNVHELSPFMQRQYFISGLYSGALLDKAVFRSGWDDAADFMAVTGINGAPHGHYDGNGISQYISGDRLWLFEGDYIKKFPYDQNSIVVSRDGMVADQRKNSNPRQKSRISQIRGSIQSSDRKTALLSLLLENYNGVDWVRNICYAATNGFWVVDELDVKKDGHYVLQCYWRSIGQFQSHGQSVEFVQAPSDNPAIASHFFITEGSGATRMLKSVFEVSHGRKNGNLTGYEFADLSTKYLIQRREGNYKKNDKKLFVNFMQAVTGENPKAPVVHRLASTVFLAESGDALRLAVIGRYFSEGIDVDAEVCFIGPEGVLAKGARRIKVGAMDWSAPEAADVALEVDRAGVKSLLEALRAQGAVVASASPAEVPASEAKPFRKLAHASLVTKVAGAGGLTAVGEESGLLTVYSPEGEQVFAHQFPNTIRAISPLVMGSGSIQWAVSDAGGGRAAISLLDSQGNVVWENSVDPFHDRNGTVTTLFPAWINGDDNPPAIIAGSEGWHYYAFDLAGQEIWREPVFHAATVGAAGDMNGNGKDDIAPGIEYYFHSLIDNEGTTVAKKSTSPFDYSVAVCDLNSDGTEEAIFGRGDGCLYVMTIPGNKCPEWMLNVGGKPVSIVELENAPPALAAATDTGVITFVDGRGKRTGTVNLPAPITDMELWDGSLLAVARDGYAYILNLQGDVQHKVRFQQDADSVHPPEIAVAGDTAAFFSGPNVFFLK